MTRTSRILTISGALLLLGNAGLLAADTQSVASDWSLYGRDAGARHFSPLTQITRDNVRNLKVAWTYRMRPAESAQADPNGFLRSEATPLVVDGVMYLSTPYSRVVALDAGTGSELWAYALPDSQQPATRGVSYWPGDRRTPARIIIATQAGKLIALEAGSGKPAKNFGVDGIVELKTPEVMNGYVQARLSMSTPPLVFRNLIITGSYTQERPALGASGDVRAWDARTGMLVWTFHSVPRPGEFGHDTWERDSWKHRSGVNVWTIPVADLERGIVYLPLAAPTYDRWGGDRKGANLFGNSIVAVDGATGKYLWHFQTVHHDIWDLDLPSATLVDVKQGRRTVPAIVVANKAALLFILDRLTGKPIYEVKEVPVPTESEIPGEAVWPTQPMPVKPEPLARLTFKMSDLTDLTPEIKARCEALAKEWKIVESRLYEPPRITAAVPHFPGGQGGMSWGGSAFDPASGYFITNITNMASAVQLSLQPDGTYASAYGYRYFWDAQTRIPCQRPPWGELVAVNVNTGEIAWRATLGVTDSLPEGMRDTGRPNAGGPIATAGGLVFVGATDDSRLRAFDSTNGKLLWETLLPASIYATPMTYQGKSGKQFVAAVNTGGMTGSKVLNDEVTAFALSVEGQKASGAKTSDAQAGVGAQRPSQAGAGPMPASPVQSEVALKLINERCASCHPVTQILAAPRRLPAEWRQTVHRMMSMGAELSAAEAKTVSDYLGQHYSLDTPR
jgi:quinoprotein glucose dehydrogenase